MSHDALEDIRDRLRNVILNTCNKIGCDNCDLKWDDGCSATELQGKELELMMGEYGHQQNTKNQGQSRSS